MLTKFGWVWYNSTVLPATSLQLPAASYQPAAISLAATSYQRLCRKCKRPIEAQERLNKRYCQAKCRAFVWSRANRQFVSAITVADFANVREELEQYQAFTRRRVIWYALIRAHPSYSIADKIGESTFPPKDRKTKRSPDETGKICFSSTPYYNFAEWFEAPRVPVVGVYRLLVRLHDSPEPVYTNRFVDVRKAFRFPCHDTQS